jgi:hypothetical protein
MARVEGKEDAGEVATLVGSLGEKMAVAVEMVAATAAVTAAATAAAAMVVE